MFTHVSIWGICKVGQYCRLWCLACTTLWSILRPNISVVSVARAQYPLGGRQGHSSTRTSHMTANLIRVNNKKKKLKAYFRASVSFPRTGLIPAIFRTIKGGDAVWPVRRPRRSRLLIGWRARGIPLSSLRLIPKWIGNSESVNAAFLLSVTARLWSSVRNLTATQLCFKNHGAAVNNFMVTDPGPHSSLVWWQQTRQWLLAVSVSDDMLTWSKESLKSTAFMYSSKGPSPS